jgi:hypothetical protein
MVPRILWGALVFSTCLLFGVALFLLRAGSIPDEPAEPFMLPALGVVSLVVAIVSVVLPRHMHRKSLELAKLEVLTEVDERGGAALFRDAAPTIRVFAKPDAARRAAFARYFTPFILGMSLSESIALWGFTLVVMGEPLLHALPFWVVCWSLMIPRFPTLKRVYGPLERAHDAILM